MTIVMKAIGFERRHPMLLHQLIVGAGFLTYLFTRDDVVWRFVKDTSAPHALERLAFVVATLLIAVAAGMCTWAQANAAPNRAPGSVATSHFHSQRYLGELLYAIGLGSLAPLSGFIILVGGEALRIFRLSRAEGSVDRLAELLAGASFLVGLLLNLPLGTRVHDS